MSINKLSIRNFRSIANLDINTCDLNILVGQNDEGKSNVLRALDLFFNYGKGYDFEWDRDYCAFALKRKQKAEEITIEIVVSPPQSFAKKDPVVWRKVWRKFGLHQDSFAHHGGKQVSPQSKIAAFLKAIRFDYVPAIKGKDYFQTLMAKLHDMLEATVEEHVRAASGAFTASINENTKQILEQIQARLGLQTTIQLPASLRELFAQLEFTSVSNDKAFSLNQRGDGIKVRHIPIVLRWLAQQANHLSAPGRPKTVTIWGYEEPENNLELRRCFELAKEFVEGAAEIQSFVTTHSPAFYSVFRESDPKKVGLFLVTKPAEPSVSSVRPLAEEDMVSLDGSMGLLALLAPHFKEAKEELKKLRSAVGELTDISKPTIFCEGPSDKIIYEEALKQLFPAKADEVIVRTSVHHGGGHAWVGEMLIAWSHSRPLARAVGIFDKDLDAQKSLKDTELKLKVPASGKMAFCNSLIPGAELKICFTRKIAIPFGPEELFSELVWDYAEDKQWLEERANPMALYKFTQPDKTFNEFISDMLPEKHLLRMALKRVKREHKVELSKYVCELENIDERKKMLEPFKLTLETALKHFVAN